MYFLRLLPAFASLGLLPRLLIPLLLLFVCFANAVDAVESQPANPTQTIAVESQTTYQGTCQHLVLAGDNLKSSCGESIVVLIMTNGSVSITVEQQGDDLGLFGTEVGQGTFAIHGAFLHSRDNVPLQGNCIISANNSSPSIECHLVDAQGLLWEIQFKSKS